MSRTAIAALALVVGLAAGIPLGGRLMSPAATPAAAAPSTTFSAVPDAIGTQDVSGPYEVVEGWPQDLSTLPGHEKWTYGGARGIFAESPNRVFLLGGGELPKIARPQTRLFPEIGPNAQFPLAGLPWRNANTATPPGAGGSGQDPAKGMEIWRGASAPYRELGVDARWEHSIVVVNAEGKIIEEWTQWDKMFKRPHAVYISPYDAEKHVWVVDDHTHAIYKFTNDGKQLVQTIGTPNANAYQRTGTRHRILRRVRSATPAQPDNAAVTRKAARPAPSDMKTPCNGSPNGKISESTIGGIAAVTKPIPRLISMKASTGWRATPRTAEPDAFMIRRSQMEGHLGDLPAIDL